MVTSIIFLASATIIWLAGCHLYRKGWWEQILWKPRILTEPPLEGTAAGDETRYQKGLKKYKVGRFLRYFGLFTMIASLGSIIRIALVG